MAVCHVVGCPRAGRSASSGHPSSTSLNPLAWSLQATRALHFCLDYHPREQQYIPAIPFLAPPTRKYCYLNPTHAHHRHHSCLYSYILHFNRCPRPFPASPPSSSTSDAHEMSVQFGGRGVDVGASSAPASWLIVVPVHVLPHDNPSCTYHSTSSPFTSHHLSAWFISYPYQRKFSRPFNPRSQWATSN